VPKIKKKYGILFCVHLRKSEQIDKEGTKADLILNQERTFLGLLTATGNNKVIVI